jgi:peptide-methionine (S)-S-oxide reductase
MKLRLLCCVSAFATGLCAASFPEPPAAQTDPAAGSGQQVVVLAGGCFWGMQGVFEHVKGVVDTTVGYAGGQKNTARYETVSTGRTGHAESVKITFDPSQISFGRLLEIYFSVAHDPTTLNRQHYDVGTHYIRQLEGAHVFRHPIVTQVVPLKGFYAAESYHQHYLDHNPTQPYIVNLDLPLIASLKKSFPELYVR